MNRKCIIAIGALAVTFGAARLHAQTAPSWNRKVDAIAVTPTPGAPSGMYDIHVTWKAWNDIGVLVARLPDERPLTVDFPVVAECVEVATEGRLRRDRVRGLIGQELLEPPAHRVDLAP